MLTFCVPENNSIRNTDKKVNVSSTTELHKLRQRFGQIEFAGSKWRPVEEFFSLKLFRQMLVNIEKNIVTFVAQAGAKAGLLGTTWDHHERFLR